MLQIRRKNKLGPQVDADEDDQSRNSVTKKSWKRFISRNDSSSTASSQKNRSKASRRKSSKRVGFHPSVAVREIRSVHDMSDREYRRLYWTADDYVEMMEDALDAVTWSQRNYPTERAGLNSYFMRLEHFSVKFQSEEEFEEAAKGLGLKKVVRWCEVHGDSRGLERDVIKSYFESTEFNRSSRKELVSTLTGKELAAAARQRSLADCMLARVLGEVDAQMCKRDC